MTATARVSVWALPAAVDAPLFANEIDRLADAAGSSPFPPHITVFSSECDVDEVAAALEGVVAETQSFAVELVGVQDSEQQFRCVSLTVGATDPLLRLRDLVATALAQPAGPYAPHLSLLYARIDAATRVRMRRTVTVALPCSIAVDGVALVDTSDDDFTRWAVVRAWQLPAGPTPG